MKKIIFLFAFLALSLAGFYYFMTYDRVYSLGIEIDDEIESVAASLGYTLSQKSTIPPHEIPLPKERAIKHHLQQKLSKAGLVKYGKSSGQQLVFANRLKDDRFNCIYLLSGDHIIGIALHLSNINTSEQTTISEKFKKTFPHYDITIY